MVWFLGGLTNLVIANRLCRRKRRGVRTGLPVLSVDTILRRQFVGSLLLPDGFHCDFGLEFRLFADGASGIPLTGVCCLDQGYKFHGGVYSVFHILYFPPFYNLLPFDQAYDMQ